MPNHFNYLASGQFDFGSSNMDNQNLRTPESFVFHLEDNTKALRSLRVATTQLSLCDANGVMTTATRLLPRLQVFGHHGRTTEGGPHDYHENMDRCCYCCCCVRQFGACSGKPGPEEPTGVEAIRFVWDEYGGHHLRRRNSAWRDNLASHSSWRGSILRA